MFSRISRFSSGNLLYAEN